MRDSITNYIQIDGDVALHALSLGDWKECLVFVVGAIVYFLEWVGPGNKIYLGHIFCYVYLLKPTTM